MRNSRTAPLVDVEAEHYCEGILTAIPAELPCGGSRNIRGTLQVALKGAFADLSRGFFRVMGLIKTTVLTSFTLAAYNLDRISNTGQVRAEREWTSRRVAQAAPSPPAVRDVGRDHRGRPRSPADLTRRALIQAAADRARGCLDRVPDRRRGGLGGPRDPEWSDREGSSDPGTPNRAPARGLL